MIKKFLYFFNKYQKKSLLIFFVFMFISTILEIVGLGFVFTIVGTLNPTNVWDFPIEGICSIRNCTYQEFEERLLQIYSMPEKDYFSKLSKDKCYLLEYDEKISTIEILKKKIDPFIADNY